MAAATFVVVSVLDEVKSHINDVANALGAAGDFDGLGGTASDDLKYESLLMEALTGSGEQTLTLTKQTTGLYKYTGCTDMALWFATPSAPFAGEDDVTYRVFGLGPSVKIDSGTPTATTIEIIGAMVDYRKLMAHTFLWLADTKATQIAMAIEGQNIDVGAVRDSLIEHARLWQGVITSAT